MNMNIVYSIIIVTVYVRVRMLTNIIHVYQQQGYCVTGQVISPAQQLRLRNKADSLQADECVIFNNAESDDVNGPENDRKRRQAGFTDTVLAFRKRVASLSKEDSVLRV